MFLPHNWGEPERASLKLVVYVHCMSVMCPKFYGENTESPTLVVVRASGVPENLLYQNGKPHMLRKTCSIWHQMLPLIPEKSDLKGEWRVLEKVCAYTIAVHGVLPMTRLLGIKDSEIKLALKPAVRGYIHINLRIVMANLDNYEL